MLCTMSWDILLKEKRDERAHTMYVDTKAYFTSVLN